MIQTHWVSEVAKNVGLQSPSSSRKNELTKTQNVMGMWQSLGPSLVHCVRELESAPMQRKSVA